MNLQREKERESREILSFGQTSSVRGKNPTLATYFARSLYDVLKIKSPIELIIESKSITLSDAI